MKQKTLNCHREQLVTGVAMICFSHTATEDYVSISDLTLIFNLTVPFVQVPVTIVDDAIVEGDQSFFGNLNNPVGRVTLDPAQATVTITDDPIDSKFTF